MASLNSPFSPQEFQTLYLKIDDNLQTEVESFDINRTDGGRDVKTLVRGWAGRVKGAEMADITVKGVIPYMPNDTGGSGFSSGGMVTGKGVQLDQTMLTSLNGNSNLPVKFTVPIGQPAAQKLVFKGIIHSIRVSAAVGTEASFQFQASGEFQLFQS